PSLAPLGASRVRRHLPSGPPRSRLTAGIAGSGRGPRPSPAPLPPRWRGFTRAGSDRCPAASKPAFRPEEGRAMDDIRRALEQELKHTVDRLKGLGGAIAFEDDPGAREDEGQGEAAGDAGRISED